MDKSWTNLCNILSDEYAPSVKIFLLVSKNHVDQNGKTRCSVSFSAWPTIV